MADMARRTTTTQPPEDFEENILDIDVAEEMRGSYLEYAYSVIYQRALPDAPLTSRLGSPAGSTSGWFSVPS